MHRARSFEALGRNADALGDWRRMLALLPEGARQRNALENEVRRLELATGAPAEAPAQPAPTRSNATRVGGIAAAALALLSKGKLLLLGLTKLKTVLSMVAMAAIYTALWGWKFGVGIVLLIYVHEMGHVIAIRQRGLDSGWPVFIPFLGALVRLKSAPRTPAEDAYIGYAGPLFGSIAAVAVWGVGLALGSPAWTALAFFGFYINFFNLLAIPPLDGGRVTNALGREEWLAVVALLWAGVWWNRDGMVLLVAIVATVRAFRPVFGGANAQVSALPARERRSAGLAYAALALFLIGSMGATRPQHQPSERDAAGLMAMP